MVNRDVGDVFGNFALVVLFPGYLTYHFLANLGVIGQFLGGYFGVVSLLLLPFLLLLWLLQAMNRGLQTYEVLVVIFLTFCIFWTVAHYLAGAPETGTFSTFAGTMAATTLLAVLFLATRLVGSAPRGGLYLALSILMAAGIISLLDETLVLTAVFGIPADSPEYVSYQGYARSILVVALLALVACKGVVLCVHVALTAVVLFIVGARAEFAGFLVAVACMGPFWVLSQARVLLYLLLAVAVAIPLLLGSGIDLQSYRVFELLSIQESTSFQSRSALTVAAWDSIVNSPILGAYGSHLPGNYAHNALGSWVSFGLVGFALYVYLIAHALIGSFIRMARSGKVDSLVAASYVFNAYSAVMVIAAKHVSDPVIALGWGLYAAVLWAEKPSADRARPKRWATAPLTV